MDTKGTELTTKAIEDALAELDALHPINQPRIISLRVSRQAQEYAISLGMTPQELFDAVTHEHKVDS